MYVKQNEGNVRENVFWGKYIASSIRCFENEVIRLFDVASNLLACTNAAEIKLFDLATGECRWDFQLKRKMTHLLFKIVDGALLFVINKKRSCIKALSLETGQLVPSRCFNLGVRVSQICVVQDKIFAMASTLQEFSLEGERISLFNICSGEARIKLRDDCPTLLHTEKYVVVINECGILIAKASKSEPAQYTTIFPLVRKITAAHINDNTLALAIKTKGLSGSTLFFYQVESMKDVELSLDLAKYEFRENFTIRDIRLTHDTAFLKIRAQIIRYNLNTHFSQSLGKASSVSQHEGNMQLILDDMVLLFKTYMSDEKWQNGVLKINFYDRYRGQKSELNIPVTVKDKFFGIPIRFHEGAMVTHLGGNQIFVYDYRALNTEKLCILGGNDKESDGYITAEESTASVESSSDDSDTDVDTDSEIEDLFNQ